MRKWIKRVFVGFLGFALITVTFGVAFEQWSRWSIAREYKPTGRLVEVDGLNVHLHCSGEGAPTVVLESGLDLYGSLSWVLVQPEIAKTNRVCSYDRAGILWSEQHEEVPSANIVTQRLHRLLEVASEKPPYLLVGHSMGGLLAMVFADRYRQDVVGLVLIDSSHPEQAVRFPPEAMAAVQAPPPSFVVNSLAAIGILRVWQPFSKVGVPADVRIAFEYMPRSIQGLIVEFSAFDQVLVDARAVVSLGVLPLIVLSRGKEPEDLPPEITEEIAIEVARVWSELQGELTALSAKSDQRVIDNAGHYIQFDNPTAVIRAIQDVVRSTRSTDSRK